MKNWLYGVLGLVLGIGLFVGGLASMPGDTVKCGERVMSPGDTCTTIRKGRATDRSYDEQKSKDGREAVIMMIVGPLLAIGCGVLFLGPALTRRRKAAAAYPAGPAAGHGYPAPGGPGYVTPGHGSPGHGGPPSGYPPAPPAQPGSYQPSAPPGSYPPPPAPGYPPQPGPAYPPPGAGTYPPHGGSGYPPHPGTAQPPHAAPPPPSARPADLPAPPAQPGPYPPA
ncbi:hypothetical protein [Actinomadura sp. NPDC048394]|uniref:hypothetical protein n=1 Tax=Actinomadura sp. NPDC048394 TaxID=3158223 RepID=UPI0033D992B0